MAPAVMRAHVRAVALLAVALVASACTQMPAQRPPPPPPPPVVAPDWSDERAIPHDARFLVDRARTFGTLVHRHAAALARAEAWRLAQEHTAPADALGSVTEQVDGRGSVRVTFVHGPADVDGAWSAWLRVVVTPTGDVVAAPAADETSPVVTAPRSAAAPLGALERAKLRALRAATAGQHDDATCDSTATAVALSWRQGGRDVLYVYRASAPVRAGDSVRGGLSEWQYDGAGAQQLAYTRWDAACAIGRIANGRNGAVIDAGERERNAPTPLDVYASLEQALPLEFASTPTATSWRVRGDHVRTRCTTACDSHTEPGTAPNSPESSPNS